MIHPNTRPARCSPCIGACIGLVLLGLTAPPVHAQKARYLAYIRDAAETGWADYPDAVARWRENVNPSVLWGYDAPAGPIYLADLLGFLYEEVGDTVYARRAAQILAEYGSLREAYPPDFQATRAEYADGLPAIANFFFLPAYSRAYLRIRESEVLTDSARARIEEDLAFSLDFQFHFPEWGAHNRAMLRAEALYYGVLALPDHPNAARWKQMAESIASDNLREWEVEDASGYHPVWLLSLFAYADASGNEAIYEQPRIRYYAEYFKRLMTPAGHLPDFGDANWNPGWDRYTAVFEILAARYDDPELKWAARTLFDSVVGEDTPAGVGAAAALATAYPHVDDTLQPARPTSLSQEVLDDVVGKKIVFRDGWTPESTYLLLNYRDEGDGGFVHREYLRNTISVEEEKMHHGHSDENDITLLMDGGSVLLHDGGYRSGLPSGPYGAYRADYFHNRLVARPFKRDAGQPVQDFLRNAGAYRPVRTQKIEFLTLDALDVSRTRVLDADMGTEWDRIIAYLKEPGWFVVIDAVRNTRPGYFTYTTLWHTRAIHARGVHYFDTSIDSIGAVALPQDRRLLIHFLQQDAKTSGAYAEDRHFQSELALYQTQSSHYRDGMYEVFVTALIPHDAGAPLAPYLDRMRLLPVEAYPEAVAVEIEHDGGTSVLGVKVDLEAELARENIRPRYTWEQGRTRYGDYETDAHILFATVTADSVSYAASNVTRVFYRDAPLLDAPPNTFGLQLDGAPPRESRAKWRYWEDRFPLDADGAVQR